MGFVCKQTAILVVHINKLDNNNNVLTGFKSFFSLYTLPHTLVGLTDCIFIVCFFSFVYFDSFDHYAACYVLLMSVVRA